MFDLTDSGSLRGGTTLTVIGLLALLTTDLTGLIPQYNSNKRIRVQFFADTTGNFLCSLKPPSKSSCKTLVDLLLWTKKVLICVVWEVFSPYERSNLWQSLPFSAQPLNPLGLGKKLLENSCEICKLPCHYLLTSSDEHRKSLANTTCHPLTLLDVVIVEMSEHGMKVSASV